ncbi:hypothetical protein, partial [Klebsiella pneumoniae]|uniref:hypothetical protein n=1 Tax=Klebsiella pneumoniae TaxID=573 RepID=UPI003B5A1C7D
RRVSCASTIVVVAIRAASRSSSTSRAIDRDDRFSLNPLGEFVDSHKEMRVTADCPFKRADHVNPPDRKWPGQRDGLQLLGWQMNLSGKK